MSTSFDPYKTLGVSKDAQITEIRAAHRKLALKCHPDKIQDPDLKQEKQKEFQQVQQAYELLSNEAERTKYDDKVELEETLRKAREAAKQQTTASSRSKPYEHYDIYEPKPRATTFASSPSPHNVYGRTPPRSFEDDLYSSRKFEDGARHPRKTASYEREREKPSRREEEKRRRREHEEELERERTERDRAERVKEKAKEKERERLEKELARERREKERRKDEKKSREKDRKEKSDEKSRRHKAPYVEPFPAEDPYDPYEEVLYSSSSKSDKKKSSSNRKYEESPPPPATTERTTERERKNSANVDFVIDYLERSGGKAPALARTQTLPVVPTPPPATTSVYPPPPPPTKDVLEEEGGRGYPTRTRRTSYDTPRLSKEKSHKKSSSREPVSPNIVDASPPSRPIPSFHKSHTAPIGVSPDTFRTPLSRANTDNVSRPPITPHMARSQTFYDSKHGRERSRSRQARPMYVSEDSEDDRERRHRRSSRRTQSPETMMQTSYKVSKGKAVPITHGYAEELPRTSKRTTNPIPISSARVFTVSKPDYPYEYDIAQNTWDREVKYATQFDPTEITYTDVHHSSHRAEEVYT
ncbi:hypothetical protein F5B20DRAFT_92157 [Whalleya microplaca]|nr:hypothetical protein F5B20DRAFT_92157 [Whalleya microplaca]